MKTVKVLIFVSIFLIVNKGFGVVITINQSGSTFSPQNVNVNVGDVIHWAWSGGSHTTTSKTIPQGAAAWDSPLNSSAQTFDYTVTVAGVYSYVCTFHESMGMTGSFTASVANSIKDQILEDYRIYPNPATSSIFLPSDIEGKLKVYDVLGNEKIVANTQDLQGFNVVSLDVSELLQGFYFISFYPSDSKRRVTWKFLKK